MATDLTNPQSESEGLNLEHSLAPPLFHHQPQRLQPSLALKRRQYKTRSNNMMSTTSNQEPAASKERRERTDANNVLIEPPYPWSTNRLAKIHTMEYMLSNNIVTITGDVKCKECKEKYEMEYDLVSKFEEIKRFVKGDEEDCHDGAPSSWVMAELPNCWKCRNENCVEPVIPNSGLETVNWLFLLLGRMVGCLKLSQLRYFHTHNNNHRTGAKDRLVYYTYVTLVSQLQPSTTNLIS